MAKARVERAALARDIALLPRVAVGACAVAVAFYAIAACAVVGAYIAVVESSFRTGQNAVLSVDAGCALRTRFSASPEPVDGVVLAFALCQVLRVVVHAHTITGAKKAP